MANTPARMAYTNLLIASGVVITSSGDFTGYPAANLSNPARWKKWRSSQGTGDAWIKFDLGSNQSFRLLAATDVLMHTGGGTLKFQANATDAWGAPTVSDTVTLPAPDLTHVIADWLSASQNLRWIRFYFTNTGATNTYVEIGAAVCAPYFEPVVSIQPGVGVSRRDLSMNRMAIGGQRSTVVLPKYHTVVGNFVLQSAAERDTWRAMFDANGSSLPVVFGLIPGTASLTFYGTLAQDQAAGHHDPSADLWDLPFTFMEDVS